MPRRVECESEIAAVTVYARGAVVTRRIQVSDLPVEACDIVVQGVTPFAVPGSFRAGELGRDVLGVTSELMLPEARQSLSELSEALRQARRELHRMEARRALYQERRDLLSETSVDVGVFPRSSRWDMPARLRDGLTVSTIVAEEVAEVDRLLREVGASVEDQQRVVNELEVELAQATTAEQTDGHEPTRALTIRLASGATEAGTLEVSYAILAARWWPAYTVRVDNESRQVEWEMEAFVAQLSGEDWEQARVELATADLNREVELPELPSWRLGRAQPKKETGFRPPPENLDRLFAGYDRSNGVESKERSLTEATGELDVDELLASTIASDAPVEKARKKVNRAPAAQAQKVPLAPPPAPESFGDMMVAPMSRARSKGSVMGAVIGAPVAAAAGAIRMVAGRSAAPAGYGGGAQEDGVAGPLEPAAGWLDFDRLRLAGADEPRRGRLVQRKESVKGHVEHMANLEALDGPRYASDPGQRGEFDHIYTGEAQVDIPSDGALHRVPVLTARVDFEPRFRTVPLVSKEVFREIRCRNPLQGPILHGPADVFVGGAMLATAEIEAVDRGGMVSVGLGVEDRLRVVRNVISDEDETTVLGFASKTIAKHTIEIELASALGHDARVEVLDRIPVTWDDEVSVTLEDENPISEELDEYVNGNPVRGGRIWRVDVPAGGTRAIRYVYHIKLPSKREITGGNRRD